MNMKAKIVSIVAALAFSASLCLGQTGGCNSVQIISPPLPVGTGAPAKNIPVRVCTPTALGTPCSPIFTPIYYDAALTSVQPNPTSTDSYGWVSFCAVSGNYLLQATPVTGISYSHPVTVTPSATGGIFTNPAIFSPTITGTDAGVETLVNKTLTAPVINGGSGTFGGTATHALNLPADFETQSAANPKGGTFGNPLCTPGNGVYNVQCYGAIGDGIANDQAAIQAAIDACQTAGAVSGRFGRVLFPQGTYLMTTYVTAVDSTTTALQYKSCAWHGLGQERSLLQYKGSTVIDTVIRTPNQSEGIPGGDSSGGIFDLTIDGFQKANRLIMTNYPVDAMWYLTRIHFIHSALYQVDFNDGWVNAHLQDCRWDGWNGYAARFAPFATQYGSSLSVVGGTFGTAGSTTQPSGLFLVDNTANSPGLGTMLVANARIEINGDLSSTYAFLANSGLFTSLATGGNGIGVNIHVSDVFLYVGGSSTYYPYVLNCQTSGQCSGTTFVLDNFDWQGMAGFSVGNYFYGLIVPWTTSGSITASTVGNPQYSYSGYNAQTYDQTQYAYKASLRTDAADRWHVKGDGTQEWCAGGLTNSCDATLSRAGPGVLNSTALLAATAMFSVVTPVQASFVQAGTPYVNYSSNFSSGSATISNVASGDTLLILYTGAFGTWTISDSLGTVVQYPSTVYYPPNMAPIQFFYETLAAAGTHTITVNCSVQCGNAVLAVVEYTPADPIFPINAFAQGTASASAFNGGTATTTVANTTVVGFGVDWTKTAILVAGSGFTSRNIPNSNVMIEDKAGATASTYSATFTGGSGNGEGAMTIALAPASHQRLIPIPAIPTDCVSGNSYPCVVKQFTLSGINADTGNTAVSFTGVTGATYMTVCSSRVTTVGTGGNLIAYCGASKSLSVSASQPLTTVGANANVYQIVYWDQTIDGLVYRVNFSAPTGSPVADFSFVTIRLN